MGDPQVALRDPGAAPSFTLSHRRRVMEETVRRRSLGALIITTILALTSIVNAQVRYVDEDGVAHWVASEAAVPEQYRSQATRPPLPAGPSTTAPAASAPPSAPTPPAKSPPTPPPQASPDQPPTK